METWKNHTKAWIRVGKLKKAHKEIFTLTVIWIRFLTFN